MGDGVTVAIENHRKVPLDAYEFRVDFLTKDGESRTAGLRSDWYRSKVFGDRQGEGAIQPGERRVENLKGIGLSALVTVELAAALYRDQHFEGDAEGKAVWLAAREKDAAEYGFWRDQLKPGEDSASAKARLVAVLKQRSADASEESAIGRSARQLIQQIIASDSPDLSKPLGELRLHWEHLQQAALAHKR